MLRMKAPEENMEELRFNRLPCMSRTQTAIGLIELCGKQLHEAATYGGKADGGDGAWKTRKHGKSTKPNLNLQIFQLI